MITWFTGDVFDGLATLDDGSIDLVVTSPPFLALRSYLPADHPDKAKEIGSEATPAEFLDTLLKVTAELRRVLAPHGSIAVELGDTYAGSGGAGGDHDPEGWRDGQPRAVGSEKYARSAAAKGYDRGVQNLHNKIQGGGDGWPLAKSKTLIPELYRIALAYGFNPLTGQPSPAGKWRVRNVVTWCRPNPPVGALGDKWRPATSDVVIACTSPKRYWDDLATRRAYKPGQSGAALYPPPWAPDSHPDKLNPPRDSGTQRRNNYMDGPGAPLLDYWEIPLLDDEEPRQYGPKESLSQRTTNGPKAKNADRSEVQVGFDVRMESNEAGAPLLDYWEIPPTGYSGAHYAVYPPALVEPLVKAMAPQRVCRTCGEPSRRIVETRRYDANGETVTGDWNANNYEPGLGYVGAQGAKTTQSGAAVGTEFNDLGFTDCGHDDWRTGRVLDPFAGSGTTLAVASGHGHDAIGFDLDPRNEELAKERVGPLLWG